MRSIFSTCNALCQGGPRRSIVTGVRRSHTPVQGRESHRNTRPEETHDMAALAGRASSGTEFGSEVLVTQLLGLRPAREDQHDEADPPEDDRAPLRRPAGVTIPASWSF